MIRAKTSQSLAKTETEPPATSAGPGNAALAETAATTPLKVDSPLRRAALAAEEGPEEVPATEVGPAVDSGGGVAAADPDGAADTPQTPAERATAMLAEFDTAAEEAEANGTTYVPSIQRGEEAAELLREATAGMTPEERTAFFEGEGRALLGHVEQSMAHAGEADADQASYEATVTALMRAGEEGGAPVSDVIAETFATSRGNYVRLTRALAAGIESGNGGQVAARIAHAHGAETWVHTQILGAFRSTNSQYRRARDQRIRAETDYAPQITADGLAADHPELFDPEQRTASRTTMLETLDGARLREEETAAVYASTLEGQAWLARQPNMFGITGTMAASSGVEFLSETEAGRQAAAASLLQAGRGEDTWITDVATPRMSEGVRELVTRGALEGVALLKATGSGSDAAAVVRGAAEALSEGSPKLAEAMRIAAPALEASRDPADYLTIMQEAAATAGIHVPTADEMAAMRERGEALDPNVSFLQQLGVFAGAGEEFAASGSSEISGTLSVGEKGVALGSQIPSAVGRNAPPGLGAIEGALKAAGGLNNILAGSGNFQDWVNLSLGSGEATDNILQLMGRNTGQLGERLMRGGALAGGAFATVDLVEALRDGRNDEAAVAAAKLTTSAVALRLSAQAAKRFLGVVGVGWTAYDIATYISSVEENNARSRELLGPAAAEALGVSPEAADDFAEFAGRRDGTALNRFDIMSTGLGMSSTELARAALPEDATLRMFLLGTINNAPPHVDDERASDYLGQRMAEFRALAATPRRQGEPDYLYRDRLQRVQTEAEINYMVESHTN